MYEKNTYFTLLGVWNNVMSTPVRRMHSLSYNIKIENKKIESTINGSFRHFIDSGSFPIIFKEIQDDFGKKQYFIYDYSIETSYQEIYKVFCLELRKVFVNAKASNCFRCFLETQWPKMIFILLYNQIPINAFSIPLYKLLDTQDTEIANVLLPELIPDKMYRVLLNESEKSIKTKKCIEEIGKFRILLLHYNLVIVIIKDNQDIIMTKGIETWFSNFCINLNIDDDIIGKFLSNFDSLNSDDQNIINAVNILVDCLKCLSHISERIINFKPIDDILELLQSAIFCILLLSSYL